MRRAKSSLKFGDVSRCFMCEEEEEGNRTQPYRCLAAQDHETLLRSQNGRNTTIITRRRSYSHAIIVFEEMHAHPADCDSFKVQAADALGEVVRVTTDKGTEINRYRSLIERHLAQVLIAAMSLVSIMKTTTSPSKKKTPLQNI